MEWWQQLIPRERQAVVLAAISLLALLVYQLAWVPLQKDMQQSHSLRERLDKDYAWMHRASQQVKAYGAGAGEPVVATAQRSLLVEVDDSLKRAGMSKALEEIKPDGSSLLRVALKGVAFDKVMDWLGYLKKRNIRVTSSVANRLGNTPKMDIRLTFERS